MLELFSIGMVAVVADDDNDVISHVMPLPDHEPDMEALFTNNVGDYYGWLIDPDDDRYYRLVVSKLSENKIGSLTETVAYIVRDEQLGFVEGDTLGVGFFEDKSPIPPAIKELVQQMRNFEVPNYTSYNNNGVAINDDIRE